MIMKAGWSAFGVDVLDRAVPGAETNPATMSAFAQRNGA